MLRIAPALLSVATDDRRHRCCHTVVINTKDGDIDCIKALWHSYVLFSQNAIVFFHTHALGPVTMVVPTSCRNIRSKGVTKRTREANHSALSTKQFLTWHDVCQLWHVLLIVFQHSTPQMITHCRIYIVHLLLFLHQNRSLVTCLLRKNVILGFSGCNF